MQAVPLTSRHVHMFSQSMLCLCELMLSISLCAAFLSPCARLCKRRKVRNLHPSEKRTLARNEDALALTTETHRLDGDSCTTTPPPLDNLGSGDGGARAVHC